MITPFTAALVRATGETRRFPAQREVEMRKSLKAAQSELSFPLVQLQLLHEATRQLPAFTDKLREADLDMAMYSKSTRWPSDFDPAARGAILEG